MSSATFGTTLEPATFYMGAAQEEALARLEWLLEQRQRLGLVVAAGGLGKSHLAAMAVRRLGGLGAEAVLVPLRGIGDGNWLEMLLDRMPLDPASRAEPRHAWQKLDDRLRENTLMERTTALVCDDIDHAPADAVEGILRLIASPEPRHSRVLVVATVRPEGLARLPDDLVRRSVVRIELEPWSSEAVANFLDLSVRRDGIAAVFSPDAAETIARLSGGGSSANSQDSRSRRPPATEAAGSMPPRSSVRGGNSPRPEGRVHRWTPIPQNRNGRRPNARRRSSCRMSRPCGDCGADGRLR
jgi:type II secretory pathway predicted ATPase ExeA